MRHRSKKIFLGRPRAARNELFRAQAISLLTNKKIETTITKAKALKPRVEKLITKAGDNTLANRRYLLKRLHDEKVVKLLVEEVGPQYKERPGGYTRIKRLERRSGDGAQMVTIELV